MDLAQTEIRSPPVGLHSIYLARPQIAYQSVSSVISLCHELAK